MSLAANYRPTDTYLGVGRAFWPPTPTMGEGRGGSGVFGRKQQKIFWWQTGPWPRIRAPEVRVGSGT